MAKKERKKEAKREAKAVAARAKAFQKYYKKSLRAKVDVAQTTELNAEHWSMADSLSADSALTVAVRSKVRDRARYEVLNNSYAKGIVQTHTNSIVGTGPRLQCVTDNEELNEKVEMHWKRYARAIRLVQTLRQLVQAKTVDGESFALLTTGPDYNRVTLDVRPIECDQVTTPTAMWQPGRVDGIEFNELNGRPTKYHLLKQHPGDIIHGPTLKYECVWASYVIHLFRADRPGQHRGLSEITPALELFAILRRFGKATLHAAETAASFALFLKTTGVTVDPAEVEAWQAIAYKHGAAVTLPDGWDVSQLKAEHPTTTFDAFVKAVLREIARCLDMPYNIAACDSAGYNYSSGRLDHQIYGKFVAIEQDYLERECLDRIFAAWLQEAILAGVLPVEAILCEIGHEWQWDPLEDIDPQKTTAAQAQALQFGLDDLPSIYGSNGRDWRKSMKKQARALGMTLPAFQAALRNKLLAASGQPIAAEAESEVQAAAPTGEFGNASRLQWKRNMKAIDDVRKQVADGSMTPLMGVEMLQSAGVDPDRAQRLVDDVLDNGQVDDPSLLEVAAA